MTDDAKVTWQKLSDILDANRPNIERIWYGKTIPGNFECPCCHAVSYSPEDITQNYCGWCHWWTGDPVLGPSHLGNTCEVRVQMLEKLAQANTAAILDDDLDEQLLPHLVTWYTATRK